jgi:hypothetical protein
MFNLKYVLSLFKKPVRICDLDFIDPERDLNPKSLRIARHSDLLGNYDVDGVSFDGEYIFVSGESPCEDHNCKPAH